MKRRGAPPSFTPLTRRASLLLLVCVVAACGGQDVAGDPASTGSAELYVHSFVPTAGSSAGASYDRQVTFTQSACATTTPAVGPCSVNLCFMPSVPDAGSSPLPNAGQISIDGAQMTPLALEPQNDGYTSSVVDGQLAWTTGGESVTFEWESLPGNPAEAGGSITLATPPYIGLTQGSAFVARTSTLARSRDLTVSWTYDTPPSAADQVAIDLDSASTQLVCIFSVSARKGVIPTAALQLLPPGAGKYNVHSKQGKTLKGVDGTQWTLGFNVDAQARSSDGLAMGSITFE